MVTKKPSLLFVSYYFPPTKSIACIRNFNICSELASRYKIHVFSTSNSKNFSHDHYPPLDITSKRLLWTFDLRTLISQKPLKSKIKKGNSSSFIFRLLNSFPFNIIFGIGGLVYTLNGILAGINAIKKEGITILYSSYFPYCDHLVCYFLKLIRPDLTWIADFRDLQYYPESSEILFPRLQEWFNKKVLKNADVVQTVSQGLKKHLIPFHDRVLVVRNSIGAINSLVSTRQDTDSRFRIAYTGNIIPERSNPEHLFAAISEMYVSSQLSSKNFLFTYAGSYKTTFDSWALEYGVSDLMETHELLPFSQSRGLQEVADVNILLGFNYPNFKGILTGKFYEYLGSKKPILLIINGEKDAEFEELFRDLNCGIVVYHKDENAVKKIADFLSLIIKSKLEGKVSLFEYNLGKLQEMQTSFQLEKLFNFLESSRHSIPSS